MNHCLTRYIPPFVKRYCSIYSVQLKFTMFVKSALPTPTMTIESGRFEASTIRSTVLAMSVITPSCYNYEVYSWKNVVHTFRVMNIVDSS